MAENTAHKQAFIKKELEWYEQYLLEGLRKSLHQKGIGITEELFNSLYGKVSGANDNSEGQFDLSFLTKGRFVDMGAGRGYKKGVKGLESNRDKIYRLTARKQAVQKRRPKKWYSKVAYGTLDRLIMRLVSNYEEEIINSVKTAQA